MTALQLDRFAPVRVRYLSQQSWNKHKQASCCTQRVNGQFPPAPTPSQRQLPPEMDCPMNSHDVCEHVYVCSLGHIYTGPCGFRTEVLQARLYLLQGHWPVSLHFCLREPVGHRGAFVVVFFFNFPKTSRRTEKNKTSQWVVCWKMALSCSLQSPWERDIQVSLQSQKSLVHGWYNVSQFFLEWGKMHDLIHKSK